MKKFAGIAFTIFQVFYFVTAGCPVPAAAADEVAAPVLQEIRGYSGLITIVCSTAIESMQEVLSVTNLTEKSGMPQKDEPSRPEKAEQQSGIIPAQNSLSGFTRRHVGFKALGGKSALRYCAGTAAAETDKCPVNKNLSSMSLSIFLFLCKLKMRISNPRGPADEHSKTINKKGKKNPHYASCEMRVFLLSVRFRNQLLCICSRMKRKSVISGGTLC